jgi:DNA-directed RNA polymerase subunit alpha
MSETIINQPNIKTNLIAHAEDKYQLTIEPLIPGFGYTLGNSLRRVLLSSVPGFAVTKIKINDLTHEYQTIDGVVEDAIEVILNLKLLRARIITDENAVSLSLTKNVHGDVYASDFEKNAKVEIINPDLYICTLDKGAELTIEVEITRGTGYLSVEQIKFAHNPNPYDIYVDALFSPVSNVSLNVEQVRVGDKTNFDKIDITFNTDKSVEAVEIVNFAIDLVTNIFSNIKSSLNNTVQTPETLSENSNFADATVDTSEESKIDLPKRILNILQKNDVNTNEQLVAKLNEVEDFPGITEKSFASIKDYVNGLK